MDDKFLHLSCTECLSGHVVTCITCKREGKHESLIATGIKKIIIHIYTNQKIPPSWIPIDDGQVAHEPSPERYPLLVDVQRVN